MIIVGNHKLHTPFFSIIIVTWNGLEHLKRFLPSVVQSEHQSFEIILSDNASTDDTVHWVNTKFPDVKVITLEKNFGYCGGNNQAAKHASGKVLIFLNNDVEVEPNWLTPLEEIFQDEDVEAAQPKIKSFENKDYFEYAGAAGGYVDSLGYPFCKGRIFDTLEKDVAQYEEEADIFWASGAALAIRKDIFFELGGFEESFEFHMEEIDLCWRLLRSGKKIKYVPKSTVYHLGGGSLNKTSPRKTFYNFRNNWWMLQRNYNPQKRFIVFTIRLFLDLIAFLKEWVAGKTKHADAIKKGVTEALSHPQAYIKMNHEIELKPKSIVLSYYLFGKKTFDKIN